MKDVFKINSIVWISYGLYFIALLVLVINTNKAELHLLLNGHHNAFFDLFFKYLTYLGDGVLVVIVGLILSFLSFKISISIIGSYIFSGIFVQIGKRLLFADAERPVKMLENYTLHLVDGVKIYHYHSFPSGHTTTVFAFILSLILFIPNKIYKILLLVLAILTAYSRVYLSQHFMVDTLVGSAIGVLSAVFIYYLVNNSNKFWLQRSWLALKK